MKQHEYSCSCKVCGEHFWGRHPMAELCSYSCKLAARRIRYATDEELRERIRERARKYRNSRRGRLLRQRALERRRRQNRLPWYEKRLIDLPRPLQGFQRLYWRAVKRIHRGNLSREQLKTCDVILDKYSSYRPVRKFTPQQINEIRAFVRSTDKLLDRQLTGT